MAASEFGQLNDKNIKGNARKSPLACMTGVVSGMLVLDNTVVLIVW